MTEYPILNDLALVIVGSAVFLLGSRPLKVPPILAYMGTGLVLGPLTGLLRSSGSLDLFSELGVALLLFVVGLELSIERIRDVGRVAVVTGVVQVTISTGVGFLLAQALGFPPPAALMVGLVSAFSSTVVVVKLLERTGDIGSLHGRLAIGILLVQDVLVAAALMLLGALAGEGGGDTVSPWLGITIALLGIFGLAVVGAVAARTVLPPFFRWLSSSPEGFFVVGLTWAFGFILAAEALHVSVELGAFIAGVVLAQLPYNDELKRRTHPLVDFFLAVFFVSLGARMELGAMTAEWPAALAVSGVVLLGKPLLIALLLGLLGQPSQDSVLSGLTLGQISEFAFILAGLAAGAGIVGPDFFAFVGLVGFLTMGTSAVVVPHGGRLVRFLDRLGVLERLPGSGDGGQEPFARRRDHIVVIGMNTLGRMIADRFHGLGEPVVVVDTDEGKLAGVPGDPVVGDATSREVLQRAGVPAARLVVSTLQIEDVNSLVAYRCKRMGVPVSIHAFDPSTVHELLEIGADHLMVSKHDGIGPMEEEIRRLGVLG